MEMGDSRSMRAVKGNLGGSPKERYREVEGPRPGYWHVTGNRLRSNRRVARVNNICQWVGEKDARSGDHTSRPAGLGCG